MSDISGGWNVAHQAAGAERAEFRATIERLTAERDEAGVWGAEWKQRAIAAESELAKAREALDKFDRNTERVPDEDVYTRRRAAIAEIRGYMTETK
jgi:hypothetical protein